MATKAYTTLLRYKIGAGAITPLARVKSIKPPKLSGKNIDITVLDSPDEMEELLSGLGTGGEIEATIEYDKTQTGTLAGLFRTAATWSIKYPSGSGWTFAGWLNEIGEEEVVNGEVLRTTIKMTVSGLPVHSATLT